MRNCKVEKGTTGVLEGLVSIPKRDYEELQVLMRSLLKSLTPVSIPKRDYEELQAEKLCSFLKCLQVSIPKRDYEELQGT